MARSYLSHFKLRVIEPRGEGRQKSISISISSSSSCSSSSGGGGGFAAGVILHEETDHHCLFLMDEDWNASEFTDCEGTKVFCSCVKTMAIKISARVFHILKNNFCSFKATQNGLRISPNLTPILRSHSEEKSKKRDSDDEQTESLDASTSQDSDSVGESGNSKKSDGTSQSFHQPLPSGHNYIFGNYLKTNPWNVKHLTKHASLPEAFNLQNEYFKQAGLERLLSSDRTKKTYNDDSVTRLIGGVATEGGGEAVLRVPRLLCSPSSPSAGFAFGSPVSPSSSPSSTLIRSGEGSGASSAINAAARGLSFSF